MPHPVAFLHVSQGSGHAAVVGFIPADGVEQKFAVFGPVIMQRLAANDFVRDLPPEKGA
jgi:hypothetical protein